MARKGRRPPRAPQPLPPPLPPEKRTVGQLVAETVRFYGQHFFHVLPLGLSVAALTQLTFPFGHKHVRVYGHPPAQSLHDPKAILEGDFQEGDTVRVDVKDGELVFEKAGVAEPAPA